MIFANELQTSLLDQSKLTKALIQEETWHASNSSQLVVRIYIVLSVFDMVLQQLYHF